jgi:hypothetical protein
MEKLYARFVDLEPLYFYPGILDHYPEGTVVSYGHGMTIKQAYVAYSLDRFELPQMLR